MIDLSGTILNALKTDFSLNKLINGKVFELVPPTKQKPPYITFFELANDEGEAADDDEYTSSIEFQVDLWTSGSYEAIAIEVCRVMKSLGFSRKALPTQYEEDTKIVHKPYQFSINKEVV